MIRAVSKKSWVYLWLSFFIILLDQCTKYLAFYYLIFGRPIRIFPFFNFSISYNTGAAFSFLGGESGWQIYFFSAISLLVVVALIIWLGRIKRSERLMAVTIALIIGGALGNLIDRIHLGYVVDFFDFHIMGWHFATFNVADSAICIGAFLLIFRMLFLSKR